MSFLFVVGYVPYPPLKNATKFWYAVDSPCIIVCALPVPLLFPCNLPTGPGQGDDFRFLLDNAFSKPGSAWLRPATTALRLAPPGVCKVYPEVEGAVLRVSVSGLLCRDNDRYPSR